jgi:hypothetical protein
MHGGLLQILSTRKLLQQYRNRLRMWRKRTERMRMLLHIHGVQFQRHSSQEEATKTTADSKDTDI